MSGPSDKDKARATAAFQQLRQSTAQIQSVTDTETWVKALASIASLIPQGTLPRLLTRPVSFASPKDRDELLKCLGDDDDDALKRAKDSNYLLSDWVREARQSGTLALLCSTDNLTFERTAEARGIQADALLSQQEKELALEEAKEDWLAGGGRYTQWHCVAVCLVNREVSKSLAVRRLAFRTRTDARPVGGTAVRLGPRLHHPTQRRRRGY